MDEPYGFSWVEKPRLAALARPESADDLAWLRRQGIEVLVSLTEDPVRRDWINEAGLLGVHVPMIDMEAPTPDEIDRCVQAITRAHEREMGVAVHCGAGLGRTGVVLACYFVHQVLSAQDAMAKVRRLRPGSIETDEQAEAVVNYARRKAREQ